MNLQIDITGVLGNYPLVHLIASFRDTLLAVLKKYSSNSKDIYSWEAEMLKSDDFEETSNSQQS